MLDRNPTELSELYRLKHFEPRIYAFDGALSPNALQKGSCTRKGSGG